MDAHPEHSGDFLIESETSLQADSSTLAGMGPRSLAPALELVMLLVPASGEVANVAPLVQSVELQIEPPFGLLLIHDVEDSATAAVANEFARSRSWFDVTHSRNGTGYGAALRTGFHAIGNGPVVVLSLEGCDNLDDIGRMRRLYAEGHPIVSGCRDMRGGHRRGGPRLRHQLGRWTNRLIRRFGRMPIVDPTSRFRLYDASLVNELNIESQSEIDVAVELAAKALARGQSVIEIPTSWRDRSAHRPSLDRITGAGRLLRWCRHARQAPTEPHVTLPSAVLKPLDDSHLPDSDPPTPGR